MMLPRFALLAVVVVALASLTETRVLRNRELCDDIQVVLKPDDAKKEEYTAACEYEYRTHKKPGDTPTGDFATFMKCFGKRIGLMTAAGVFDEAGFRTYIAGKLATATTAIQNHVNSRLDGCLIESSRVTYDPEDPKTFRILNTFACISSEDCATA